MVLPGLDHRQCRVAPAQRDVSRHCGPQLPQPTNQCIPVLVDHKRVAGCDDCRGELLPGLIQGNPVNAYWRADGKDADNDGDPSNGYPHAADPVREDANGDMIMPRADILMIFTGAVMPDGPDSNV